MGYNVFILLNELKLNAENLECEFEIERIKKIENSCFEMVNIINCFCDIVGDMNIYEQKDKTFDIYVVGTDLEYTTQKPFYKSFKEFKEWYYGQRFTC